ncbi:Glutamine synthetase [Petrocella atlantisensis]|uniref:Glutamine synthetase n=1 Tax=Petrocella atlantisensis TaxID=2173034 RepID=A0A3P7S0S9_9FIRM|nr:glutamine synthetase III [Petrocella atlantisensis]MCF8018036.1 glutamine synthetase III [Vallitaleaceae bacterium]VDN46529.1 Glutamine synthetase [Petrocella atlantisensis]
MENVTQLFGTNVFSESVMKERLPKDTFKALKKTMILGQELAPEVAEVVANAMKDWAVEKGATHYTHWFQPMTGKTAEKHDSFIEPTGDGKVIMEFSGKQLIQGEPDASSFPNGGLRATFEARGYTAWDATSPAFLKDDTLCIPTAFCSYTGEALDKKTPLLRSMQAVSEQAVRILRLFGDTETNKVTSTVGPEQEYFLVDKKLFQLRKDLIFSGRTLFGAMPPKGQELDDHYFGSIKERVSEFMKEFDLELWKLGISSKTKHNEVAPAQHEMAPIYSTTNIATDHNQLVMDTLIKVANRHDLACLLHEKPFAGVNGSGKHNNWSISTENANLLEPGDTPHENAQFLTFLVATIAAVDKYAPLLRLSAASPGNDHRLGANEAPPAVISIFLGEQLNAIIEQIKEGALTSSTKASAMDLGVTTLPKFAKDVTDRNRTSPFAFTGNKFEFRMVGSSASVSGPNIVLNTIVAEVLKDIADELEVAEDFNATLKTIIERLIKAHSRIIFNGDGYSEDWLEEAERRELPNIKTAVEAIKVFDDPEYVDLFLRHGVFFKGEIAARQEIMFEEYIKTINIEALTMIEMAKKEIMPSVIEFATSLADSINAIKAAVPSAMVSVQENLLIKVSELLVEAQEKLVALEEEVEKTHLIEDIEEEAFAFKFNVFEKMVDLRKPCDELEVIVAEDYWPYPTYSDLLFRV